ncbi:MAG: hypothetical protein HYX26_09295 [Acidobacteriales bacterium]|nr:hypothetical protein [Terriglobales bacterium]
MSSLFPVDYHADVAVAEFFSRLDPHYAPTMILEYDGVLAPRVPGHGLALPYPEIPAVLERLLDTSTRLILLSGRRAAEVVSLLGLRFPVEVWGCHGMERLGADGRYSLSSVPAGAARVMLTTFEKIVSLGLQDRVQLKPGALSIDWRGLDAREEESLKQIALDGWRAAPAGVEIGLRWQADGGELRIAHPNETDAVRSICRQTPIGARITYLGGYQSEQSLFRFVKQRGMSVMVCPEFRESDADLWLTAPRGLKEFLLDWLQMAGNPAQRACA